MTPGEVLVRFLSFFGRQFDASRLGISVGRGALNNPFALSPAVDPRTGMPVMDAHVVIEDPLDREKNVARSCFGFPQVTKETAGDVFRAPCLCCVCVTIAYNCWVPWLPFWRGI